MYKQKLIDLLKSDKEIKMKMEKLEFWCKVYNEQTDTFWLVTWADWMDFNWTEDNYEHCISHYSIIWLPLQERFITMYLNNKLSDFNNYNVDYKWIFLYIDDESIYIEIDKRYDYNNQNNETYKKIYESLYNLNK